MPLNTYLINKSTKQKYRLNGIVPSDSLPRKEQLRQHFVHHVIYTPDQLPPKVDLRPEMTSVEDQSRIGSCVANALAGAYEYLTKRDTDTETHVSRLFIYYNARVEENKSSSVDDSGCSMTDAIEALEAVGTCLESIWPYDISKVNAQPDERAYERAEEHKINEAFRVNVDLHEMKSCLAQGFPIAFALKLFSSFSKAAETAVVPTPNVKDGGRESTGSHAMLAVGYSVQSNAFIVRNSWGEDWGDKGYCYIPFDYMTNPELCFDMWTVRKVANDDFGQGHWHFNDHINFLVRDEDFSSDDADLDNYIIDTLNEEEEEEEEEEEDQGIKNKSKSSEDLSNEN